MLKKVAIVTLNPYFCNAKRGSALRNPNVKLIIQKTHTVMKKLFLTFAFAVSALAMNAQLYVGGEVGAWRNWDDNHTSFNIAPEVGYNLSDKWAVGLEIGYNYEYQQGQDLNIFGLAPYARYTFANFGPVNLFLDGGLGYYKADGDLANDDSIFEVGLKPGLSVNLTDKLSFVSHVGFLGYRDADAIFRAVGVESGLGFDLSGQALTFGLYYNF